MQGAGTAQGQGGGKHALFLVDEHVALAHHVGVLLVRLFWRHLIQVEHHLHVHACSRITLQHLHPRMHRSCLKKSSPEPHAAPADMHGKQVWRWWTVIEEASCPRVSACGLALEDAGFLPEAYLLHVLQGDGLPIDVRAPPLGVPPVACTVCTCSTTPSVQLLNECANAASFANSGTCSTRTWRSSSRIIQIRVVKSCTALTRSAHACVWAEQGYEQGHQGTAGAAAVVRASYLPSCFPCHVGRKEV